MPYYRLYFLERRSEHFTAVIDFSAADDQLAIGRAESTPSGLDRELWNLGRLVWTLKRSHVGDEEAPARASDTILRWPFPSYLSGKSASVELDSAVN
jgi:hypothetical protein